MNSISRILAGSLAVVPLAAFMVVAAPVTDAQALTCKPSVTGGKGRHMSKPVAKKRARIKWRAKVTLKYGASWKDWGKAKNKYYSCGKYGTIHKKWACTARANPCK